MGAWPMISLGMAAHFITLLKGAWLSGGLLRAPRAVMRASVIRYEDNAT